MPIDDKTANALADYFSSSAGRTAVAAEPPPGPEEGGQGEVGAPIPQTGPRAPTISDEQANALADSIENRPMPLAAQVATTVAGGVFGPAAAELASRFPLLREAIKGGAQVATGIAGGTASAVRGLVDMFRSDLGTVPENNFVGKPLAEVQAQRDELQTQRDQLEQSFKEGIATGKMAGLQGTAAGIQISELQRKIDEANGVLQSGQVKTAPVEETGPLKFLSDRLRQAQEAAAPAKETIEQAFPTTQELDQSVVGQIARGAGQMGAQLPFMFAGPEVAAPAFAAQFAGSTYDEARAKGADDRTAQIAALASAMGTGLQMTALEAPTASLAKMLEGSTPTKAIADVGRAIGMGGIGMGGLQFYQNLVARLTGYDPNRPLEEGVAQQAILGAGLDAFVTAAGRVPGLMRYARPAQVEVRERPGAPAVETPQVEPAPATPMPMPAPTEPLAEAAAAVRGTQGTAEQTLAAQGSPQEQLAKSSTELQQALSGAGAEPALPAASVTLPAAPVAPETPAAGEEARYQSDIPPNTSRKFKAGDNFYEASSDEHGNITIKGVPSGEQIPGRWMTLEEAKTALSKAPPPANIRGEAVPPPLPERAGVSVTPDQVKATTNQAAEAMGMDQRVHYVASADDLPGRVRKALSEEQRAGTAQTVYDKTLGELWVIGDRFDGTSQAELNRTLIHDTLPRVYGDISELRIENNPADPRLGYYDIAADRPVLNEAALLRTQNPFEAASKTALEEIVAHQGITRLFGTREAPAYVAAMHGVRQRFDALGLSDTLAQEKGFKNLDDMAKAYGFEDYASNPRHNNGLTEELWAAYAQRYKSLAGLQDSAPQWYRQAINTLSGGLRRRFGLGMSDLDVQNLVSDSFGALRQPKWGAPSEFNPEIAGQAKRDMAAYQLAARRGEGEGPGQTEFLSEFDKQAQRAVAERIAGAEAQPPPLPSGRPPGSAEALAEAAAQRQTAGVTDMARIGDLFVAGQRTETRAGLQPGEGIRAQPFKLSTQQARPIGERMAMAERVSAVYDVRGLQGVTNDAREIFHRDFGDDVYRAMDDLLRSPVTDAHTAMRAVIDEASNAQIADFRARGFRSAADSLEMAKIRFNREMEPLVTNLGQALNSQKLLWQTADTAVGRLQAGLIKGQARGVGNARGVGESFRRIGEIGQGLVRDMLGRFRNEIDSVQARMDRITGNPQSLATRYIDALATSINSRMGKLGFTDAERPMLQELFNRFGARITDALKDPAAEIPTPEAARRMSTTASIRETLSNFPMFERAWDETLSRLKTENPNSLFFSKVDNALAQPFGEAGVRQVVRESGNNVRDLIFRHFSTQGRIGNELASSLTEKLGLPEDQALRIQELFDNHYRQLLRTTAANELEQTLKRIGNPAQRSKGELERLTDLMAIGGLDKQEYYNLLAPRFGLGGWNPQNIAIMKAAGSMLQRIHDEGGPEVYKNQIAAQLADEIAKTQPWKSRALRQAEGLWMASLLTGPFTHGSYYGQNLAQVMTNLALHTLFKPGVSLGDVAKSYGDLFNGMVHSARTELPYILQTGIHTQRELPGGETAGMRAEGIPFRSALESTPLPGGMRNPLNWYRYVGRFLQGMETVFYRGANLAITRSLAIRLADERGMSSEEGQRFAEQTVYGTENDRQEAVQQAREEQQRYGFSDKMRGIRENELLDQKRFARAPELADEAHRFALHSAYRESPYGFLGTIARSLSGLRRDNPQMSLVTPFINLPANVANEFMNWTPIGLLRGRDALTGFSRGTKGIEEMYKDVPQFAGLVERGGIRDTELRDLSYEYLAKGAIGTLGMAALGAMTLANRNNPDPPFAVNGAGPADLAHRDELRAAGWQPYSIKIGDRYFDYQASPWKSMLGLVGGMADEIKYGKGDPQNWVGALANTAIKDGLSTITDASFLQGLQTLLAAGGGTGGPGVDYKIKQFLSQEISSAAMIPFGGTGTKQLYRAFDPREFSGKELPEMVLRNMPALNSAFLQPKLNVLGEPVEINPLHRLLAAPTVESQDPVWKFLDQHNIALSLPNTGRKVDGVQMNPAELHEFTQVRGQYLKTELGEAINNSDFRALDPEAMDTYVKELERAADDVGKTRIQDKRGSR
jgi:hypothetical protein